VKKILAILLALIMTVALVACGNGEQTPQGNDNSDDPKVTTTPADNDEPADSTGDNLSYPIVTDGSITLTWFYPIMSPMPSSKYDDLSQNYAWSQVTKNTGIKIVFDSPSIELSNERFNLMVTSGQYTDLATVMEYSGGGDKAIEDEVFLRLNELMDKYAPDYMAILNSDPNNLKDATTDMGNRWRFCQVTEGLQLQFAGLMIRQDWLDELGFSELPRTYDEMHDVLVAFRDNKAEGPFHLTNTGMTTHNSFNGGFGVASYDRNYYFVQRDGKAICSIATEEFKDYLKLARQWYAEKLIDQEFFSHHLNGQIDFDLMYNDKIGLIEGQQIGSYYADMGMAPEGAYFEPTWSLVKNKGDKPLVGLNSSIVSGYGTAIFTTCKHPEAATRFLNYLYTDQGYIDANFGTKGVTFNYVDGKPVLTEMITNPEGMSVWDAYCTYLVSICSMRYAWARSDSEETLENRKKTDERWSYNGQYPENMVLNLTFTADEGTERANILSDMQTYVDTMTVGFIVGNNDIDSEWDSYIKTLKSIGLDRLTEIYQTSLDRYNQR
jgi:putative aldouronate transport system substrate-binding protein